MDFWAPWPGTDTVTTHWVRRPAATTFMVLITLGVFLLDGRAGNVDGRVPRFLGLVQGPDVGSPECLGIPIHNAQRIGELLVLRHRGGGRTGLWRLAKPLVRRSRHHLTGVYQLEDRMISRKQGVTSQRVDRGNLFLSQLLWGGVGGEEVRC